MNQAAVKRLEDARLAIGKMLAAAEHRIGPEALVTGSIDGESAGLVREIATAVIRHCPGMAVQIGPTHTAASTRMAVTCWWQA